MRFLEFIRLLREDIPYKFNGIEDYPGYDISYKYHGDVSLTDSTYSDEILNQLADNLDLETEMENPF